MLNRAWFPLFLPWLPCVLFFFSGIITVLQGRRNRGYETHVPIRSASGAVQVDFSLTMQAFFSYLPFNYISQYLRH